MTMGCRHAWIIGLAIAVMPVVAGAESLVAQADLERAGFQLHWAADVPLTDGDTIVAGYVRDEVIYIVTDQGMLFAVTAKSGLIRWAHAITSPDYTIYPPTHIITTDGAGPVVVPATTETFIFDRFTGRQLRRYQLSQTMTGPVVAVDDIILGGAMDNRFRAIRVSLSQKTAPLQLWEVATDGPITARPLLFDGDEVLFASRGGTLYGCRVDDKKFRFSTRVGGSIWGDPAIDATGAYVSSTDRSLYKVDTESGAILWRVRFQAPLETGPQVIAGIVLQMCERDGVTAVESDTGKVRWKVAEAHTFAVHTRAGDVFLSGDKNLLVVNHQSGDVTATLPTVGVSGVAGNPTGDAVFLLGTRGKIDALRLGDVPYLKRQQILAARRRLNQRPVQVEAGVVAKNPPRRGRKDQSRPNDPLRSKRDRG